MDFKIPTSQPHNEVTFKTLKKQYHAIHHVEKVNH